MSQELASTAPNSRGASEVADAPTPSSSSSSLKRRASSSFDCTDDNSRKRLKEEPGDKTHPTCTDSMDRASSFVDDLAQELQCGCCSELVYRPVLVMPCQHFFCGSCCVLWIKNGGTNCPACRGLSTVAMPFRALQSVIDSLLRAAPHKARAERERQQADEIYTAGHSLRLPPPREISPPPDVNRSTEYVHPCPHCVAGNTYGWVCPQPVVDPNTDVDHAWHVDDGLPPGHGHCGNCENLLALRAPQTTRCDFCLVSFCGIQVPDRCLALPLMEQAPHGMATHADLIQSSEVYECFDGNTVEVEIMLEYLDAQSLTPRHMYREVIQHTQKQPRGFAPLIELDLFADMHGVAPSIEPNVDAPRNNICRMCSTEVLLYGLKEWWLRERQKGFLEETVMNRKDCPTGSSCTLQKDDHAHAREFNHIFTPPPIPVPEAPSTTAEIPPEVPPAQEPPVEPLVVNLSQSQSQSVPFTSVGTQSNASLSFLLNADEDSAMGSPEEMRSSTPDIRDVVDALSS